MSNGIQTDFKRDFKPRAALTYSNAYESDDECSDQAVLCRRGVGIGV
jgi:hypothetical protein